MTISHISKDKLSFVKLYCSGDITDIGLIQEAKMSVCNSEVMTNDHPSIAHPVSYVADVLRKWRYRYQYRIELARMSDQDFHDIGASWSDYEHEVNKPFWRA
jgi:uncharacterized protein YjiS (DUF1127 family)